MEKLSSSVKDRESFVRSMTQFIEEKKKGLEQVLKRLDMSAAKLSQINGRQVCPYNKNHLVATSSSIKHIEICRLLSAGYQIDQLPALLQDLDFCYKNHNSIMKIEIDERLLNKIIWDHCVQTGQGYTGHRTLPISFIDENILLSQEDKLAVYNSIVKTSHQAGKVIPVDRTDDLLTTDWGSLVKKGLLDEYNNKQFSSKLEQLAALRDLKRRRQSYRAKNVHVTKKSYTEIIREVICNQMEILTPGHMAACGRTRELIEAESDRRSLSRESGSPRDGDRREKKNRGISSENKVSSLKDGHKFRGQSGDSPWPDTSQLGDDKTESFNETDDLLLQEIKDESLNDTETVTGKARCEDSQLLDDGINPKSVITKKRRSSGSESSSNSKRHKRQKSKHKKKHNKKSKRRN